MTANINTTFVSNHHPHHHFCLLQSFDGLPVLVRAVSQLPITKYVGKDCAIGPSGFILFIVIVSRLGNVTHVQIFRQQEPGHVQRRTKQQVLHVSKTVDNRLPSREVEQDPSNSYLMLT